MSAEFEEYSEFGPQQVKAFERLKAEFSKLSEAYQRAAVLAVMCTSSASRFSDEMCRVTESCRQSGKAFAHVVYGLEAEKKARNADIERFSIWFDEVASMPVTKKELSNVISPKNKPYYRQFEGGKKWKF